MNIINKVIDIPERREASHKLPRTASKKMPTALPQTLAFPVNLLIICEQSEIGLNLSSLLSTIRNLHLDFSKKLIEPSDDTDIVLLVANRNPGETQHAIEVLAEAGITTILLGDNIDNNLIRTAMHFHVQDIVPFTGLDKEMFNLLDQCVNKLLSKRKVAPLVCVINGKSGSGASFITACLGEVIADSCDHEIVLIDADLHYGSLADSLKLDSNYYLSDALNDIDRLDNLAIKSMMIKRKNLSLLASQPYAKLETERNKQFHALEPLLWKIKLNHDLVMADLSTGLETLTLPIIPLSQHIVIVVQQNIVSLREAKALIEQLTSRMQLDIAKVSIVVNRYSARVSKISLGDIKKVLGVNTVFCVSNNYELATACTDLGSSLANLSDNKTIHKEIFNIIEHIYPIERPPQQPGLFARLFTRQLGK